MLAGSLDTVEIVLGLLRSPRLKGVRADLEEVLFGLSAQPIAQGSTKTELGSDTRERPFISDPTADASFEGGS